MNNPEVILSTLDGFLSSPRHLVLYGRAALALGYDEPEPAFQTTMDVDAIIPLAELAFLEADELLWDALDKTNSRLESSGLYITHLFDESQVILRPDWMNFLVKLNVPHLKHLSLSRPASEDLVLTKMMRIDPHDRSDILFLLKQTPISAAEFESVCNAARIPDIEEIHVAFEDSRKWIREKLK
ncbi:MAG: DUF6036 family nucleotidyltransferase [Verrucomicrobiales bacterium]